PCWLQYSSGPGPRAVPCSAPMGQAVRVHDSPWPGRAPTVAPSPSSSSSSKARHPPGEVLIMARLARADLKRYLRWRGLVFYSAFFMFYMWLANWFIDWEFAGRTFDFFENGQVLEGSADGDGFLELSTVSEIALFMSNLSRQIEAVHRVCPRCQVGATENSLDIRRLSLRDFFCSDFMIGEGSNSNSGRNCDVIDAAWAERPNVTTAPCCTNATLIHASFVLMAIASRFPDAEEWQEGGNASLESLSLRYDDSIMENVVDYISRALRGSQNIVQVIISRNLRMTGICYRAWHQDQDWEPGYAHTSKAFWSMRFDIESEMLGLMLASWSFFVLTTTNNVLEVVCLCTSWDSWFRILQKPSYYIMLCIALFPLVVISLPMTVEPRLWRFLMCVSQLMALVRLFYEAQLLPFFKKLTETLFSASKRLLSFSLGMCLAMLIIASLYGQQFGVFEKKSLVALFLFVLDQFANGASLSDEALKYNPEASILLYIITLFVLFLTLSQIFIAVLTAALDDANADERKRRYLMSVPEGYEVLSTVKAAAAAKALGQRPAKRSWAQNATAHAISLMTLTYWCPRYACFVPALLRGLQMAIEKEEQAAPSIVGQPLLLSRAQLVAAFETFAQVDAMASSVDRLRLRYAATASVGAGGASAGGDPTCESKGQEEELLKAVSPQPASDAADLRLRLFSDLLRAGLPLPFSELQRASLGTLEHLRDSVARHEARCSAKQAESPFDLQVSAAQRPGPPALSGGPAAARAEHRRRGGGLGRAAAEEEPGCTRERLN
ncbi:unnamed protein product, partial [Prorocentrum cordatum]